LLVRVRSLSGCGIWIGLRDAAEGGLVRAEKGVQGQGSGALAFWALGQRILRKYRGFQDSRPPWAA